MKKNKQFSEIVKIVLLSLFACILLFSSGVYYKGGAVDRAIFSFGAAMLIGMYSSAGIISQKLGKQLSHLEELIEKLKKINDEKTN